MAECKCLQHSEHSLFKIDNRMNVDEQMNF